MLNLKKLFFFSPDCHKVFRNSALILLAALTFGVIFGSVYIGHLDHYAMAELENGLDYFLKVTDEGGQVTRAKIASNSLNTNGLFILYAVICGLAVIGLPLVVVMVAFRGALLGFTTGYLVQRLAWKGVLFALTTYLPFAILTVLISVFSGSLAMTFSWLMLKKLFGRPDSNPTPILGYLTMQLLSFFVVFLVALLEAVTTPWLFAKILPWALK